MADTLVPLGMFAMVAFVVYVKVEAGRRRHLQATEFHSRILEKMGSAREFGEFLGTEAGSRFLQAMSTETPQSADRILRAVHVGIVTLALGVALLIVGKLRSADGSDNAFWGGVIVTAIGIGTLLSAAISFRLLPYLSDRQKPLSDGRP